MISAIIEIILGLVIWQVVPGWITEGSRGAQNTIRLACNIIGIIITIAGVIALVRVLI